jgi:hypothetical protein
MMPTTRTRALRGSLAKHSARAFSRLASRSGSMSERSSRFTAAGLTVRFAAAFPSTSRTRKIDGTGEGSEFGRDGTGGWARSAPAEQVGRRWPGRWCCGREPEMGENLPDDDGVLDGVPPRACGRHTEHKLRRPPRTCAASAPATTTSAPGEVGAAPPRSRWRRDRDSSPAETTAVRSGVLRASRPDRVAMWRSPRVRRRTAVRSTERAEPPSRTRPQRRETRRRGCPARRRPPGPATNCAAPARRGAGGG